MCLGVCVVQSMAVCLMCTDNGPKEEGLVVLENLPYLLQCGVSISSMDLVSPPLLHGAVWSWSLGYPGEVVYACACVCVVCLCVCCVCCVCVCVCVCVWGGLCVCVCLLPMCTFKCIHTDMYRSVHHVYF